MTKTKSSFILKVLPRAFLICLVCLSLVAFSCYTAPKAQAEAVSLTLTTAFLMLAIAVMSTLGVTLTSSSNQDAIEYITDPFLSFLQGKGYSSVSDYLASVGITAITQLCFPVFGAVNIVKSVYDIIAEFCTSFFAENNVVSGGDDVGELGEIFSGTTPNRYNATIIGSATDNSITLSTQSNLGLYADAYSGYGATVSDNVNTISFTNANSHGWYRYNNSSSSSYYALLFDYVPSSSADFNFSYYGSGHRAILNFPSHSGSEYSYTWSHPIHYVALCIRPWNASGTSSGGAVNITTAFSLNFSVSLSSPSRFVVSPSDDVISPPSIAVGQSYSIPSANTRPDDDVEIAITDVVAPLTTTGGLSKTASVAGTAVPAEYEWLYEDTQAIRNNTNPHFDFIPSSLGFDFAIWHYVTEMMASVSDSFALLGTFINNMPPAVLVFPFGVFALAITVALLRRFLS